MRIVLAGFGNMGRALATGWLESPSLGGQITVVDPDAAARDRATGLGFEARARAAEVEGGVDVAVIAVKPGEIENVLRELPGAGLYLSIAAGRTIGDIAELVGGAAAIVRAMPNMPAAIGLGITGLIANANADDGQRKLATTLMSAVGGVEWLDDERDMDALTAISGSGPAYVFLLIECLTAAGIELGLDAALAERLATATVRGAGAVAAGSELDAAALRRQVTSPGGTTEAALAALQDDAALETLIRRAAVAAARRSRELGSA
jgi:pyrroline-5-carboxylate reductase